MELKRLAPLLAFVIIMTVLVVGTVLAVVRPELSK
jgi:hypothetical protein